MELKPLAERAVRTWAADAVRFADVLAAQDPSWMSESFAIGDGTVVLWGKGMFVNQAFDVGLSRGLPESDWLQFEERCLALGVAPSFDVSPATSGAIKGQLLERGYRPDRSRLALFCELNPSLEIPEPDPAFVIEPANRELLPTWQATAASGWGRVEPDAVRASDAIARAAAVVDGDNFVLVLDAGDRRPLGCASLTMGDGFATLGGMSTLPNERGRGVQSALIIHRLRVAIQAGCEIAAATTAPGGGSERNLVRHGFKPRFEIETYVRGGPRGVR